MLQPVISLLYNKNRHGSNINTYEELLTSFNSFVTKMKEMAK